MKALTVWQPWASLIVHDAKRFETRPWRPYGGNNEWIAIHSAKRAFLDVPPSVLQIEQSIPGSTLPVSPLGAILGACQVVRVYQTDALVNFERREITEFGASVGITRMEYTLGDYRPGRYAWRLEQVKMLSTPIPCDGRQKLWTVPEQIAEQIKQELEIK